MKRHLFIYLIILYICVAVQAQERFADRYNITYIAMDEGLPHNFIDETLLLARIQNILDNRKRYQRKFTLDMNVEVLKMEEESGDEKYEYSRSSV